MRKLNINGKVEEVDVSDDTPLLWVLRDSLKMTGTKFGCGIAQCGACTVLIDGQAMRTCILPISAVSETQKITTIEGLSENTDSPVQKAWLANEVPQCGYCQSGMIMAATALLNNNNNPTDKDIDSNITNICRCGTYSRIRRAIHLASDAMAGQQGGSNS